jgi:hypothetical protein
MMPAVRIDGRTRKETGMDNIGINKRALSEDGPEILVSRRRIVKAGPFLAAGVAFLGIGLLGRGARATDCDPVCPQCGEVCSAQCDLGDCSSACLAQCSPGVGEA